LAEEEAIKGFKAAPRQSRSLEAEFMGPFSLLSGIKLPPLKAIQDLSIQILSNHLKLSSIERQASSILTKTNS